MLFAIVGLRNCVLMKRPKHDKAPGRSDPHREASQDIKMRTDTNSWQPKSITVKNDLGEGGRPDGADTVIFCAWMLGIGDAGKQGATWDSIGGYSVRVLQTSI